MNLTRCQRMQVALQEIRDGLEDHESHEPTLLTPAEVYAIADAGLGDDEPKPDGWTRP